MVFAGSEGAQTSHIVKLFSRILLPLLLRPGLSPVPSPPRASFVVASEQRLPAKDDGRAALRHRLRIKILLTAESEFHFKVEFNYIRACLPAPFPPVSLFLPVAPRFALSPLRSHSFLSPFFLFPFPFSLVRLAFPFSSITSSVARCFLPSPPLPPFRCLPSEDASRGLHS